MLISFIILALILGGVCYIVSILPISEIFKRVIYVVVCVGLLIWLLQHLSAFGIHLK